MTLSLKIEDNAPDPDDPGLLKLLLLAFPIFYLFLISKHEQLIKLPGIALPTLKNNILTCQVIY